jgi:hypothetical protein
VIALNKTNPNGASKDAVRKELIRNDWEKTIIADVSKWKAHRALDATNILILDNKTLWNE